MPRTPFQTTPEPVERLVSRSCGWCGAEIPYSGKGRPKAYCSKSHRNRAWEVRTAAKRAGGLPESAGPVREVVERTTTVEKRVAVPGPPRNPAVVGEWTAMLGELARQLRHAQLGRQHWHHPKLMTALGDVLAALDEKHPGGLDQLTGRRR